VGLGTSDVGCAHGWDVGLGTSDVGRAHGWDVGLGTSDVGRMSRVARRTSHHVARRNVGSRTLSVCKNCIALESTSVFCRTVAALQLKLPLWEYSVGKTEKADTVKVFGWAK